MALRVLRLPEVRYRTGQSTTDIYAGMNAEPPTFPKSVPLGVRTVGWIESEVEDWIAGRIAARENHPKQRKGGPGRGHKGPIARAETNATIWVNSPTSSKM
jgi:prophage regulatory protein